MNITNPKVSIFFLAFHRNSPGQAMARGQIFCWACSLSWPPSSSASLSSRQLGQSCNSQAHAALAQLGSSRHLWAWPCISCCRRQGLIFGNKPENGAGSFGLLQGSHKAGTCDLELESEIDHAGGPSSTRSIICPAGIPSPRRPACMASRQSAKEKSRPPEVCGSKPAFPPASLGREVDKTTIVLVVVGPAGIMPMAAISAGLAEAAGSLPRYAD